MVVTGKGGFVLRGKVLFFRVKWSDMDIHFRIFFFILGTE